MGGDRGAGIGDRAPLLVVDRLTTVFDTPRGEMPAVDDVSFAIRAGETLGLVGESGSGKSVAAMSILRLVQPPGRIAGGSLTFKGRDLLALDESAMRKVRGAEIALIVQQAMTALNPVFTVGDQIGETLRVHGRATRADVRAKSIALLDAVRIPNAAARARDYPHQLSGGMRQRVLIAMALSCQPSLIIADEPTTALDVTIQAEILDLLRDMKSAFNLALLLITHDLGVVAETADRVAVMYAGRIVEEGPVRAIFGHPAHPYTQGLLASMPGGAAGERLHAIEGSVPSLGALPPGCAFNPRCPSRFEPCAIDPPPDYDAGPGQRAKCYLHAPVPIGSRADTQVGPYEGRPAVPYGGKQARTSEGQEVGSREDQVGQRLAGADRRVRSGGSRGVRPEKDAV